MKLIAALSIMLFQISAFAQNQNLDALVGKYLGTNKNGDVTIEKVLVKEADLFEPAQFIYTISMDYSSSKGPGVYLDNEEMTIDEKNQTLIYRGERECDDPGCWYIDQIEVSLKKTKDGNPYVELYYTASVSVPEEEDQLTQAEGTKLFFRAQK